MTQSMTGFARGSVTTPQFTVIVELRSVNNRFLDLHFRCPDALRNDETAWRKALGAAFDRGKIEVNIKLQWDHEAESLVVDNERLGAIRNALSDVKTALPDAAVPDALAILQMPGVLVAQELDPNAQTQATREALAKAIQELTEQRRGEGSKLAALVTSRVDTMRAQLTELRTHLPQLRAQQKQRLLDRLSSAGIEADGQRLEEELVYVAQRSDVDEEMDRLEAHLDAIVEALTQNKPCGRRLDFLMQELNREANTLSSKSTALSTTNTAVEFKVLIEQMREQIQNIE